MTPNKTRLPFSIKLSVEVVTTPSTDENQGPPGSWPDKQLRPTIGIIAPLEKEYQAVSKMLEKTCDYEVPGRGAERRYLLGEMPAANGKAHSVVLALGGEGNNVAAHRTAWLISDFPRADPIVVVGIAGGVPWPEKPEEHVRLGDIVVPDQWGVLQYDFGKEGYDYNTQTPVKIPRPPPRPPSAEMIEAARLLQVKESPGGGPWLTHIHLADGLPEVKRPPDDEDILFDSVDPKRKVVHPPDARRTNGQPRVFLGPIASANIVLRNAKLRDTLREQYQVKAVEMEASGIADTTWTRGLSYFAVRGICDYCDEYKNKKWQGYAAVIAAAYLRSLLESKNVIVSRWK